MLKNPRAIIEWPFGLDHPPIIRVLCDIEEQSKTLLAQLEQLFRLDRLASGQ